MTEKRIGRPKLTHQFIYQPEIDWSKLMLELRAKGFSPNRVATTLGVSHVATLNWLKGGEPKYGNGSALLELHRRECGQ
jgi:hypothetical protein